jgi:hypothetical protein
MASQFLGAAAMIDGARPDIVAAFLHSGASRTPAGIHDPEQMLPNGGNGAFTLHALARSQGGETESIGTRIIVAANAASALLFGTIDAPGQGAIVSGPVTNFGALTPQPKTIPSMARRST